MNDSLFYNLLANGVLALAYAIYKICDRCMHSKCKYTATDGLAFDLDGPNEESPVSDMDRIAELLKSRAVHHSRAATPQRV